MCKNKVEEIIFLERNKRWKEYDKSHILEFHHNKDKKEKKLNLNLNHD